jgi:hypothetical protein
VVWLCRASIQRASEIERFLSVGLPYVTKDYVWNRVTLLHIYSIYFTKVLLNRTERGEVVERTKSVLTSPFVR